MKFWIDSLKIFICCSLLLFFLSGCATPRPEGTNVEISRPSVPGNMLKAVDVTVKIGRSPLVTIQDGNRLYGILRPGTYQLTATSPDPYRLSDFSKSVWQSRPFELVIEKDGFYRLEVVPVSQGLGWEIRQAKD